MREIGRLEEDAIRVTVTRGKVYLWLWNLEDQRIMLTFIPVDAMQLGQLLCVAAGEAGGEASQ
jgi:hypothetical protein